MDRSRIHERLKLPDHRAFDRAPREREQGGETHEIGQEPGRKQQKSAGQNENPVEDRVSGETPLRKVTSDPSKHLESLGFGQHRADDTGQRNDAQYGRQADSSSDLDEEDHLHERDRQEEEQQSGEHGELL